MPPLGLFAFWMTSSALRHLPRHERPHRLDLIGALLIVFASVSLMLALTWGGTRYPWSSAPIVLLVMGTFIGLSIYLPAYLELVLGLTASGTGLALIPFMGGVVTGATLAGRLMGHLRRYKRPPIVGLAIATAGLLLLTWRPTSLSLLTVALE